MRFCQNAFWVSAGLFIALPISLQIAVNRGIIKPLVDEGLGLAIGVVGFFALVSSAAGWFISNDNHKNEANGCRCDELAKFAVEMADLRKRVDHLESEMS